MSVSTPCELCTTRTAEQSCDRCGQLVCERHADETTGYCVECAADVTDGSRPDNIPGSSDMPDGVDTYRF